MKFMCLWQIHEEKGHETLKAFAAMTEKTESKGMTGVKLIGRWHDVVGFTGVAIVEVNDAKALSAWLLQWNAVMDIQVVPVLDDKETRRIGRQTA